MLTKASSSQHHPHDLLYLKTSNILFHTFITFTDSKFSVKVYITYCCLLINFAE